MSGAFYKRFAPHELGLENLGAAVPSLFSPYSWRNRRLRPDHPIVNDGNQYAAKLARQARYSDTSTPQALYSAGYQSVIGLGSPIFIGTEASPRGRVNVVVNIQDGGVGGTPVADDWALGLPLQFLDVPFPEGIDSAVSFGSDHSVTIYDSLTDTVYEFWRFFKSTVYPPYVCHYGGRILNASHADPVYPNNWGASATSISLVAGMMRAQEIIDGGFRHVLSVAVPVVAAGHLPPATRDDGLVYGSSFITGGDFDWRNGVQPTMTTLAQAAAPGDTVVTLQAPHAGPGPGWYDIGVGSTSAEPRVTVTAFDNAGPYRATLSAPLTKAHDAGTKFSISPYFDGVPEGAMFRFPAGAVENSGWMPLTKMMFRAIRDYGLYISDKGGVMGFGYEAGTGTPYNPIVRGGYGNGGSVVAQLPWETIVQIQPPVGV